jgi:hypothetical protein
MPTFSKAICTFCLILCCLRLNADDGLITNWVIANYSGEEIVVELRTHENYRSYDSTLFLPLVIKGEEGEGIEAHIYNYKGTAVFRVKIKNGTLFELSRKEPRLPFIDFDILCEKSPDLFHLIRGYTGLHGTRNSEMRRGLFVHINDLKKQASVLEIEAEATEKNQYINHRFFGKDLRDRGITVCSGCRQAFSADKVLACGGCKRIYYCSEECQKSDWKEHEPKCHKCKKPAAPKAKPAEPHAL